jgi:uncharacterized protein with FMN-binding domain
MSKKTILISALVVLLGAVFVYEKFVVNPQTTTQVTNTSQIQTSQGNNPATIPTTTAAFKDGTYVGNETTSMYGKAKVQITISGGKITDVQFPEFPNDRTATMMKSNMAMPIIKQEVIRAQSANVNTVSGATQTSESFIQSISSALSQAV